MSLEDIVKALALNTQKFQQETIVNLQNLGNQVSQLATSVSRMEAQNSGKLPSQTEVNPRENASAIVLRSGKEIRSEPKVLDRVVDREDEKNEEDTEREVPLDQKKVNSTLPLTSNSNIVVPPSFPCRLARSKKEDHEKEVLETFRKVEINIPLLDAIKQIPKYAKFLKELCTN